MKHKLTLWVATAILVAVLSLLGILLFWSLKPYQLPEVYIEVTQSEIAHNEVISSILTINKPKPTNTPSVTVVQRCDDGVIYVLEAQELNTPTTDGFVSIPSARFSVPDETTVGAKCVLEFRNEYEVNPIRSILKVWQSNEYTVKE